MYLATYNGPSHSHWDLDRVEAFKSVTDAKQSLQKRTQWSRGSDYTEEYRRNGDGLYVRWGREYTDFLGTEADYITLYPATKSKKWGEWIMSEEPSHHLSLGERGGVVVERF